jgi:hypothetical protein
VLGPTHGEGVAVGPPVDIETTRNLRKRPVFSGVGGKLVQREPDGLGGGRIQTQLGPAHDDTRTNEIGKGGYLGANQVLDLDPVPCVADEEVLIG